MKRARIGSRLEYRTFAGYVRRLLVTETSTDIKNGRPGFGGRVVQGPERGMDVWGYDYQIVTLRSRIA